MRTTGVFIMLLTVGLAVSIPMDNFGEAKAGWKDPSYVHSWQNKPVQQGQGSKPKPQSSSNSKPKPNNNNTPKPKPQVGGDVTTAYARQFPEVFYILINGAVPCQGALITNKTILTSASCFWNIAGTNNSIITDPTAIQIGKPGSINIEIDATIEVFNVTINPLYRYYPLSGVHENNLAIVMLKKEVTKVLPIAIAGSSTGKADGHLKTTNVLLAAWGQITNPSNVSNPSSTTTLKFAKVVVQSQKTCTATYQSLNASHVYFLPSTMMCTNVTATMTSSCRGDEGGALRYLDNNGKALLSSIASPPIETDCPTTLPSLYTNVGAFTKWINSVTGLQTK